MPSSLRHMHHALRRRRRATSGFRLVLDDGSGEAIHLPKGYSTIGRSRSCHIRLRYDEVMLRHAGLVVTEKGVIIERLTPTAEVHVNGVPVRRAALAPGDEVLLASVRLRLERAEVSTPAKPHAPPEPERSAPAGDWVEVLERLHDWSRSGALDRRGAMLGILVEAFALRGAALLQRRGRVGLAAVNAWGQVTDLLRDSRVEDALKRALRDQVTVSLTDHQLACVACGRDGSALALAVSCTTPPEPLLWPLRLSFRFLAHEYFRDQFRGDPDVLHRAADALAFRTNTMICRSGAMLRVYEELRRAAGQRLPVVLIGETGTGKGELVRLLRLSGAQANAPLLTLACAAPPESLDRQIERLLKAAERMRKAGGALLLEDLCALDPTRQARLIALVDVLTARTGEDDTLTPRVITTLDEEPATAIARRALRGDLYHRLCAFEVRVPPLRRRTEDVPHLFDHFLAAVLGPRRPALAPEAMAALIAYPWPGNLRELRFEAARVASRVTGRVVGLADLSPSVRRGGAAIDPSAEAPHGSLTLDEELRKVEWQVIRRALGATGHRLSRAADQLGVSRGRLLRRIRELGIEIERGTG